MKQVVKTWIYIVLFAASGQAAAQNYCGSGITEVFVPDKFVGCDFRQACKIHDACYGACDQDGEKYGTPYCALPESAPERVQGKKACDVAFGGNIILNNPESLLCRKISAVYQFAVQIAGQGPFNGMVAGNLMERVVMTSDTPQEAEAKFRAVYALTIQGVIRPARVRVENDALILPLRMGVDTPAEELTQGRKLVLPRGLSLERLESLENTE